MPPKGQRGRADQSQHCDNCDSKIEPPSAFLICSKCVCSKPRAWLRTDLKLQVLRAYYPEDEYNV